LNVEEIKTLYVKSYVRYSKIKVIQLKQ